MHYTVELLQATVTLLIILDPFGLLPLVAGMTKELSEGQRARLVSQSVLAGLGLLLIFAFAGRQILGLFEVTLDDLRIAGGILLLILALDIVFRGHSKHSGKGEMVFGIVPIASPLLAGPGSITATIILVGTHGLLITTAAVVISFAATWLVLKSTSFVYRIIGKSGSDVVATVMGILLAAIAVVFIREGVFGLIAAR